MRKTKEETLLTSAVKGLVLRLESAEKFTLAQAPDIAKEIITEVYIDSAITGTISVLFLANLAVALFLCFRAFPNSSMLIDIYATFSVVFSMFVVVGLFISFQDFLMAKFTPKLTILRSLRDLISGENDDE